MSAPAPVRPPLWRGMLLLLAAATVLALLAAAFQPAARALLRRGGVPPDALAPAEASRLGGPVLWLDARPTADFERARMPGALPLNEERWNELLPAVLLRWQPGTRVIVYCSNTGCDSSRLVARRLRRECRLDNVFVLHGGWTAWSGGDAQ